jgi:V8-like Glu-specific endopeptidase
MIRFFVLSLASALFACSEAPAYAFHENVFQNDSRQPLIAETAPWSAIGKLVSPEGTYCTATLVARNLILTAAHCIMKNGAYIPRAYTFVPRYSHGGDSKSTINHFWWGTTDPENWRGQDWAIARLDTALGDTYGWMGVRNSEASELMMLNKNYYMGAYNEDYQKGEIATWEKGFHFRGNISSEGYLLHDADMSRGASGAAIFAFDDALKPDSNHVVAISVAEFRDGGSKSLVGVPYTDGHANIAVPSSAFYEQFMKARDGK